MLNSTTIRTCLLALAIIIQYAEIPAQSGSNSQPKLIVGIVVDQMRFDHLYRYQEMYSDTGFKRLMSWGL